MEHSFPRGHDACRFCGVSREQSFVSGTKCKEVLWGAEWPKASGTYTAPEVPWQYVEVERAEPKPIALPPVLEPLLAAPEGEAGDSRGTPCPECGCDVSMVVDSREAGGTRRRRRMCASCKKRYSTYEVRSDQFKRFMGLRAELDGIRDTFAQLTGMLDLTK
jgi:hypothetical protein